MVQALILGDTLRIARASFAQIRRAAEQIIMQCMMNTEGPSTGGIASNIGMTRQVVLAA